jgi:hypothetical protein
LALKRAGWFGPSNLAKNLNLLTKRYKKGGNTQLKVVTQHHFLVCCFEKEGLVLGLRMPST